MLVVIALGMFGTAALALSLQAGRRAVPVVQRIVPAGVVLGLLAGVQAQAQQGGMRTIDYAGATWAYTATEVGTFGPEHAEVGHRGMTGPSVTYTFHSRNGAPLGTADFRDADKVALSLCLATGRGYTTAVPPRLSAEGVLTIAGACTL